MNILKFKYKILFLFILTTIFNTNLSSIYAIENNSSVLDGDYLKKKNTNSNYILGGGDILSISISSNNLDKNIYLIDLDGTINIPNLGDIFIEGLTIEELTKLLNEELKKFVYLPDVKIRIINFRPIRITTVGELNNPGVYTLKVTKNIGNLEEELQVNRDSNRILDNPKKENSLAINRKNSEFVLFPTLFDALKISGGITYYSDLKSVEIIRKNTISNGGGKIKTKINFNDLFEKGESRVNLRLFDGDYIKVNRSNNPSSLLVSKAIKSNLNPRTINVMVTGKIPEPGLKIMQRESTLNEAFLYSGGKPLFNGQITLVRYNSNMETEVKSIRFNKNRRRGSKFNPYLKEGDIIHISNGPLGNASEILNEITDPFMRIFVPYQMFKNFND